MSDPTTNVPVPVFGDQGFVFPPEADILAGRQADINAAFGGGLNPGLSTPQGQLASSDTAIIGDANALFAWFCNQVDPAFSSGRMQDGIGRIYFIGRIPGGPTTTLATCTGLDGVIIPVGALARSEDGRTYVCQQLGEIVNGNVILPFACVDDGPIPLPAHTLDRIYQAIFGWDTIDNVDDGVLGRLVENRAEFEERRRLSTPINSTGQLPAILAAVLQVDGVLDAFATENDNSTNQVIGGVTLVPNSLYVCVLGGAALDVATAIWSRKAPGCNYTGNTTIIVTDPSPLYTPPAPAYAVTFQTPTVVDFAVVVTLRNNVFVPANAVTLIQNAIIAAFAGADGGTRARIGTMVLASRYYGPVSNLGSWSQIIDIKIGRQGSEATIVGSITGSTLTVTGVINGMLQAGQLVSGTGVQPNTLIDGLLGGTGGTGTYSVSVSQNVLSGTLDISDLVDDIVLRIDEAPAVSAPDIQVILV